MSGSEMLTLAYRAYYSSAGAEHRRLGYPRWVMDRSWYDRVRAELVSEDQEAARAQAHRDAMIPAAAGRCPVCPAGPFGDAAELAAHMRTLADPAYREPDKDMLLGLPVVVREGAGEPHLETP